MARRSFEKIPFYNQCNSFYNHDFKELLKDLRQKISKYDGKYNSKEFKEYLLALLYLDIDILRDKTYSEEQLEQFKAIRIFRRLLGFNIYGSLRKSLTSIDDTIDFPQVYDEDYLYYYARHEMDSILEMNFDSEKCIITLPSEILVAPKLRHEQMDRIIKELAEKVENKEAEQKKKEELQKSIPNSIPYKYRCPASHQKRVEDNYFYREELGDLIEQLYALKRRDNCLPNKTPNEYNNQLRKKIAEIYGPFQQTFSFDHKNEEIELSSEGIITGTSIVKETPVATWQKRIIHY